MNHVISQGWAMYWGTARWTPVEVMEAYTNCRQFNCVTPISEQSEYHMFCREKTELYMPELYNKIGESAHCSTLQRNTELIEFVCFWVCIVCKKEVQYHQLYSFTVEC